MSNSIGMPAGPIRITYLGHATVLIEIDGVGILTDPLLRTRIIHLRRVAPEVTTEQLADVDLVLVSHAHHDHLDVGSLKRIPGSPPAICPAPGRRPLVAAGLEPEVLTEGDVTDHGPISIEAVAADHDGRRMPHHSDGTALGYVIRGPSGSIYFAGDTGFFDAIAEVGPVDVALLPVAGWGPRLGPGHLNPDEAAAAAALIGPRIAIPIHWGSYERMAMKRVGERSDPARRFCAQVAELSPETRPELLDPGSSIEVAASETVREPGSSA